MTRRNALSLAPVALVSAVPLALSARALSRPCRRVVVVDLGHGATATIDLIGGGPGDDLFQPALFRASLTVDLGPDDEKMTAHVVFSGGGHPNDGRGDYLASPEAKEAGWKTIAEGGYLSAAIRPIV